MTRFYVSVSEAFFMSRTPRIKCQKYVVPGRDLHGTAFSIPLLPAPGGFLPNPARARNDFIFDRTVPPAGAAGPLLPSAGGAGHISPATLAPTYKKYFHCDLKSITNRLCREKQNEVVTRE